MPIFQRDFAVVSTSSITKTRQNMSTFSSEMQNRPWQRSSRVINVKEEDLLPVSNIQGNRWRNVFKVNIRHVYTVGQLKEVIFSRHGHSVVALLYRGVRLEDEHELAHLIPDLQNTGAPRFSVRTRSLTQPQPGGMSLHVRSIFHGASFQIHLPAHSTVADLMIAIMNYEAYASVEDFYIACAGKSWSAQDSNLALAKCNVVSGSSVQVMMMLRGGDPGFLAQSFVDMQNMSALKTIDLVDYKPGDPVWRIVRSGLNVTGRCRNRSCEAFGQTVYCRKGFVVFNIAQVVHCPACESILTASSVGFSKCQWMFEGRRAGFTTIDMMSKWLTTSGENEFQWFDDDKGRNMAEWCSLIITAKPLPSNQTSHSLKLDTKDCAICFGTLTDDLPSSNNVDMTCGHRAHSACKTALQYWGYTTCPTCRDPIAAA